MTYRCSVLLLGCVVPSRPLFFPYRLVPDNNVCWINTPASLILSDVLPSVRKEEIRVEVEDSTYMSIRTEAMVDGEPEPARKSTRKFRLPAMVDVNGIMAGYEDRVLTVRVRRALVSRGFFIDPSDLPGANEGLTTARAA